MMEGPKSSSPEMAGAFAIVAIAADPKGTAKRLKELDAATAANEQIKADAEKADANARAALETLRQRRAEIDARAAELGGIEERAKTLDQESAKFEEERRAWTGEVEKLRADLREKTADANAAIAKNEQLNEKLETAIEDAKAAEKAAAKREAEASATIKRITSALKPDAGE